MVESNSHPYERERTIHNDLLNFVRNNSKGVTMTDLVKGTKFSRKAIEKHLEMLILENEIYMKKFGITKVYYPNRKIKHLDFEKIDYGNRTIWFDVLEGESGLYLLIQKKKKTDQGWVHEHSLTLPLKESKKFLLALERILNSSRTKKLLEEEQDKKTED